MFNTVLELLKKRNYKAIREIFMDMNEADVAALLQQFYDDHEVEKYELPLLFRLLNKDVAADVFAYMDSPRTTKRQHMPKQIGYHQNQEMG